MKQDGKYFYKPRRLKDYNYSRAGAYFITICVKNRKCLFGDIENETMILNSAGKIACDCMIDVPLHYGNVELGEFIIMPNHVHAVIMIHDDFQGRRKASQPLEENIGGTQASHLHQEMNNIRQHNKLSVIVGSYKSSVTKNINLVKGNKDFAWQRYFHDHIIRNTKGLENISDYIRRNPVKWQEDLENEKYLAELSAKERDKKRAEFYKTLMY